MKSILLASTALVAFAGAAAADGHTSITFSGTAEVGFNDYDPEAGDIVVVDDEQGFYWNADLDVAMSAELDNGLKAGAQFEIDIVDKTNGEAIEADEFVLSFESDTAGIFVGDTSFAAEKRWVSAGDMESDGFSEADGENVIRGDIDFGGVSASVSYAVSDAAGTLITDDAEYDEEVDQLSFGAAGEFGMFSVAVAYQEESAFDGAAADTDTIVYDPAIANGDFNTSEIWGISAGATFAGATVTVAYAENTTADENSTGIKAAYPFGPVTATAYYVSEDHTLDEDNFGVNVAYVTDTFAVTADYQDDQGTEKWAIDGSYNVGNGLTAYAGVRNESEGDDEDYYVAGTYDLGGGAELLISYAVDSDGDQEDEIGDPEYQAGTTLELSFEF